jgi:NADH dehydrogenase [ubiquinone] 1 alpha subcomplex assembly factor 7
MLLETILEQQLKARIHSGGPMNVADFMNIALYDPDHGYYTCGDPIGAEGDFITAPEISQIFGELIGLWAAETWRSQGQAAPLKLIELGPGHGTLMADIFHTLGRFASQADRLGDTIQAAMVEISPLLKNRQRLKLGQWVKKITWHDDLASVPPGPAIILANEFFDALPIRQFELLPIGWREIMLVIGTNHQLEFQAIGEDLADLPDYAADLPVGSIVEICPQMPAILDQLAARLRQFGGAVLIIDYGHAASLTPHQANWASTLQAMSGHHYQPVLTRPGHCDVTAHVDFGQIIHRARAAGLRADGPIGQGEFLQSLGGDTRCQQLMAANPSQAHDILTRYRRLITPSQMGQLFKVLMLMPQDPR